MSSEADNQKFIHEMKIVSAWAAANEIVWRNETSMVNRLRDLELAVDSAHGILGVIHSANPDSVITPISFALALTDALSYDGRVRDKKRVTDTHNRRIVTVGMRKGIKPDENVHGVRLEAMTVLRKAIEQRRDGH